MWYVLVVSFIGALLKFKVTGLSDTGRVDACAGRDFAAWLSDSSTQDTFKNISQENCVIPYFSASSFLSFPWCSVPQMPRQPVLQL